MILNFQSEHTVEKSVSSTKKSEKVKTEGGGLFAEEGDDIFSSSQSSSVVSIKPAGNSWFTV